MPVPVRPTSAASRKGTAISSATKAAAARSRTKAAITTPQAPAAAPATARTTTAMHVAAARGRRLEQPPAGRRAALRRRSRTAPWRAPAGHRRRRRAAAAAACAPRARSRARRCRAAGRPARCRRRARRRCRGRRAARRRPAWWPRTAIGAATTRSDGSANASASRAVRAKSSTFCSSARWAGSVSWSRTPLTTSAAACRPSTVMSRSAISAVPPSPSTPRKPSDCVSSSLLHAGVELADEPLHLAERPLAVRTAPDDRRRSSAGPRSVRRSATRLDGTITTAWTLALVERLLRLARLHVDDVDAIGDALAGDRRSRPSIEPISSWAGILPPSTQAIRAPGAGLVGHQRHQQRQHDRVQHQRGQEPARAPQHAQVLSHQEADRSSRRVTVQEPREDVLEALVRPGSGPAPAARPRCPRTPPRRRPARPAGRRAAAPPRRSGW